MSGTLGRLAHPLALPIGLALVALPALKNPGEWVASGASSVTVLALMAAIVAAKYGRAETRPYWWGFAVVGWAYVFIAYGLTSGQDWTRRDLFTSVILDRAWQALTPEVARNGQSSHVEHHQFFVIGHALIALALAHAGGLLARGLSRRQDRADVASATPAQTSTN